MSGTAIEQTTIPSKLGSLPTHVIWSNDGPEGDFIVTKNRHYSQQRATSSNSNNVRSYTSHDERPSFNHSDGTRRAFQLERNLRFLKIQHQKMLHDLHLEIETLKSKNKELQFQLVFGLPLIDENDEKINVNIKDNVSSGAIDSTMERVSKETQTETRNSSHRLQHMEDELHRLRLALEDAETKTTCLNTLLSQLKRSHLKLKSAEGIVCRINPTLSAQTTSIKNAKKYPTNTAQMEEYEKLIGILRKENIEQKKELLQIRSSLQSKPIAKGNDEQGKHSSKLPRISTSKEMLPKTSQEHRNSIELPPLHHKYRRRSYSSKANPQPFTPDRDELKKEQKPSPFHTLNDDSNNENPSRTKLKSSGSKV